MAPSVVEKLSMLRAFVGETTFSETDLATCLRQSGYLVELAAERLMTGQYQPKQQQQQQQRQKQHSHPQRSSSSSSSSSPPILPNQGLSPKTIETSTITTTPMPSTVSHKRKHQHPTGRPVVTPKTPKAQPSSSPSYSSSSSSSSTANNDNDGRWLLCQRWISDGVCTQRHASTDFDESLAVEQPTNPQAGSNAGSSNSNSSSSSMMIRFRGRNIQGQFPKHIGRMATPLLQENLIEVTAKALMEERGLPIGAQVAFSMSVWLPDPERFFAIFSKYDSTASVTKLFFGKEQQHRKTKNQTGNLLCEAAFGLLQWAQHGEPYEFGTTIVDETAESSEDDEEQLLLDDTQETLVQGESEQDQEQMIKFEDNSSSTTRCLQELDAPEGFKAQLRPYQRQALWWLTQRESHNELEESSQQQLELLQELTSATATNHRHQQQHTTTPGKIECDCGPVHIGDRVDAPAVVDNGTNPQLSHPLWHRRYLTNADRSRAKSFYVQPLFGMATSSPPPPPMPCRGGILADSMGLGKTVMLLALVQSTRGTGTTLIITPLSLLAQWEEELVTKTTLSYRVHYADRKYSEGFGNVDVVLTTYGSLQGELQLHSKRNDSAFSYPTGLFAHTWKRVILDEAHCIKNTATVASRACCLLQSERRWCVSGTIIQNSLEDAFALLKFLRHEPWCAHSFWKAAITNVTDMPVALDRVKRVLSPIMLRRTKDSVDKDGQPILTLPPMETKSIMVEFSPAERQFYDALHRKSLNLFEGFIKAGTATKSWLAIFSLLHRLRQTCDHVALTIKAHIDQDEWNSNIASQANKESLSKPKNTSTTGGIDQQFLDDLMGKFRSMQKTSKKEQGDAPYASKIAKMLNEAVQAKSSSLDEECSICLDPININGSVVTPCLHIFCKDCLVGVLKDRHPQVNESKGNSSPMLRCPNGPCPVCTEEIDSSKILSICESDGRIQTRYLLSSLKSSESVAAREQDGAAREALETAVNGSSSSKLAAILQELENVWKEDPGSKVLIFSQFLGFLDLMEQSFKFNQIPFARLDGKLTLKERMAVLREFGTERSSKLKSDPGAVGSVLLISMKAGGVGLNLVAARTVFIADPWWNAAVEDQCVNRIHRIGQTADKVRVRKFYVTNSVEQRIVELQKRKKGIAAEVLRDDKGASTDASAARLSLDDFKVLFRDMRSS